MKCLRNSEQWCYQSLKLSIFFPPFGTENGVESKGLSCPGFYTWKSIEIPDLITFHWQQYLFSSSGESNVTMPNQSLPFQITPNIMIPHTYTAKIRHHGWGGPIKFGWQKVKRNPGVKVWTWFPWLLGKMNNQGRKFILHFPATRSSQLRYTCVSPAWSRR